MTNIILIFVILAAGTWFAAAAGAAMVAFIKKESSMATALILGFASGVILMVTFAELLHPAIHRAEASAALPAWVVVPGAFAVGFLCTLLLDKIISRMKTKFQYKQGVMLLGALAVHNIPEGLALGILLGAVGSHFHMEELLVVIPVAVAVAAHKIPEGTAISVAFQGDGMGKFKSFLIGQSSGFFGFLSGIVGFLIAVNVDALMPYAMAFAGGAMVWVAVHELIPKSRENRAKYPNLATIGVFLGVLLMLFVDTTLHNHNHAHCHHCYEHYHGYEHH